MSPSCVCSTLARFALGDSMSLVTSSWVSAAKKAAWEEAVMVCGQEECCSLSCDGSLGPEPDTHGQRERWPEMEGESLSLVGGGWALGWAPGLLGSWVAGLVKVGLV